MMNVFSKKLVNTWHLPAKEKLWLLLLYPYSGLVRMAILLLPFQRLSPYLGHSLQNRQLSPLATESQQQLAWRIGKIIELVSHYTPWESKCFVQAVMARTMLGWYNIPYIMHFGACRTKQQSEPMKAHTWVKVGRWIITGREGHKSFAIVGSYVAPSILK